MKARTGFRLAVFALGAALALEAGCGGSLDSSVSGAVTLDGKPLAVGSGTGTISFFPEGGGPVAYARVEPDGTYELKTGAATGIRSGPYIVTVVATGPSPPTPPGASPLPGPLLTPTRYGTRQQSDLRFTIGPGENRIDIALKSR